VGEFSYELLQHDSFEMSAEGFSGGFGFQENSNGFLAKAGFNSSGVG
jgi:hypothetical protein